MPLFNFIQAVDRALAGLERWLVIALTVTLASIMMAQVVLRYFFNAPIFWAEEISIQLLVFVTLFGLSLLMQGQQLIVIDFLPKALPVRAQAALQGVLGLGMLLLLLFMTWLGWDWVSRPDIRMELGATTQLPRWYNFSALPLAFACMAFHQLAALLRHARSLVTGAAA